MPDEDYQGPVGMPSVFRKDLAEVNTPLYSAVSIWLRKHGKGVKPKLTDEQKQQLKECFELMDQDGSGAIDAEELGAAFRLLGIKMKRAELEALLADVDHDGSGEVEYLEFLEIMTVTLQQLSADREEMGHKSEGQVPFALMATAYRRKRLMEGIIQGNKEVQAQIAQINEKNVQEASAKAAAEVQKDHANKPSSQQSHRQVPRRMTFLGLDKELLRTLGPEERRLVAPIRARMGSGPGSGAGASGRSSPGPTPSSGPALYSSSNSPTPSTFSSPARQGQRNYLDRPKHRHLLEMPTTFDVRLSQSGSTLRQSISCGNLSVPLPHPGASAPAPGFYASRDNCGSPGRRDSGGPAMSSSHRKAPLGKLLMNNNR